MKKLAAFCILILCYSCNQYPEVKIVAKWPDGKKQKVCTYYNSKDTNSYSCEFFYDNGNLEAKGNIVKEERDGFWQEWYENGNIKDESFYKLGSYVNERKCYREDGSLSKRVVFNKPCNGIEDDEEVYFYYENGIKSAEATIKNGVSNGIETTYYTSGKLCRKMTCTNDSLNGISYEYYQNGNIKADGNYINGREDGSWAFRDSTGKVKNIIRYKNGVQIISKN